MNEAEEVQATLAEHRAWVWNRFKEQNGRHIIGRHSGTGENHAFKIHPDRPPEALCGFQVTEPLATYRNDLAVWTTCEKCAAHIYNHCNTSFPEEVSVQSQVSGNSGQLVLPNSENWGL